VIDDGSPAGATRGTGVIGLAHALDEHVDRWLEPLRGRPAWDAAAKAITGLGDRGVLWSGVAAWRGRRSGPERAKAVRALAIAGVSSSVVNAGIKAVVGRSRPDRSDLRISNTGVPVREPTTSSFPSGHTLAAFCAATVLAEPGDRPGNAFLLASAVAIGASRIHLRAHHTSDVIGGAMIGVLLGLAGRRLR